MSRATKIIAAAAIGFVAGILLAPKSGKETREDLKNKALGAKDYADDKARKVKTAAMEAGDTLRESAQDVADEAFGMMKSTRRSADVVSDEAEKLSTEAKGRATRVAG